MIFCIDAYFCYNNPPLLVNRLNSAKFPGWWFFAYFKRLLNNCNKSCLKNMLPYLYNSIIKPTYLAAFLFYFAILQLFKTSANPYIPINNQPMSRMFLLPLPLICWLHLPTIVYNIVTKSKIK